MSVNIWFGRIAGILVAAMMGVLIYLVLFEGMQEESQTRELTKEKEKEIVDMILSDIDEAKVIKRIREFTKLGLVEAKNLYDEIKEKLK